MHCMVVIATVWNDTYDIFISSICYPTYLSPISRANYNPLERPPTPENMKSPPPPVRGAFSPIYPLAYRRIIQVSR